MLWQRRKSDANTSKYMRLWVRMPLPQHTALSQLSAMSCCENYFKRSAAEKGSINLPSEFLNPFSALLIAGDPLPVLANYPNISCTLV